MSNFRHGAPLEKVLFFLESEGWRLVSEGRYFRKYSPPEALNLGNEYALNVPKIDLGVDSQEILKRLSKVLEGIYGISKTQIWTLSEARTVFSTRLIGESVDDGEIALGSYSKIVKQFTQILYKYAAYKSTGKHIWEMEPVSAMMYVDNCKFMQTEKGSFITNLSLPNDLVLFAADLVSPSLESKDITTGLESLVKLMITRALIGDKSLYNQESLVENIDFLALQAAEEICELVQNANQDEMVFSFSNEQKVRAYKTGKLDATKFENLNSYIDFLREHLLQEEELSLTGYVYLLKSKDPAKDRNLVEIRILSGNTHQTDATISLDSVSYEKAIEAHHHNKVVCVSGFFKPLKKSLRCTRLLEFKVLS